MSAPGSLRWIAAHESRLAWRDFAAMMTAGRPRRMRFVVMAVVGFAALMHLLAYGVISAGAQPLSLADKPTLVLFTGTGFLFFALMLSQAMESVTRAFYARSDLDLILSSPVSGSRVFAIRIAAIALANAVMAALLAGPFVDVLAWTNGRGWLAAYVVVAAAGAVAAGLAVAATVALFRTIGPRRTRIVAQIVAALVGAAFVIGVQIVSILSYGQLSRFTVLRSNDLVDRAPEVGSALWLPVMAAAGDMAALAVVLLVAALVLGAAILAFAPQFAGYATAAGSAPQGPAESAALRPIRPGRSPSVALRHKEWALLARDPWLLSNTLMQVLYLLPPALLLWRNFGNDAGTLAVMVPVVVMASGQLAGGLAWLTISGEDAPDLLATAPVAVRSVTRAKIEAVLAVIAGLIGPLVVAMALTAPREALVAFAGVAAAALSATAIQLMFRTRARRSQFRRRQTASRVATFAEAFSSIAWAATAALAALGTWLAMGPAIFAVGVLGLARYLAPSRGSA